jgi:transposase InsO family protein
VLEMLHGFVDGQQLSFVGAGIQLSRTTAHHPAANGLVERFRRSLKAAFMWHRFPVCFNT